MTAFLARPPNAAFRFASSSSGGDKKRDYYEVLGVAKDANEKQIKAAYRQKAMTTHPDVAGGDQQKFTEVSEAYDVLSNAEKRRVYDQLGHDAAQNMSGGMGGGPGGGMSAEDIFRSFFRGGGMGDMGGAPQRPTVEDTNVALKVTLEELYTGASKQVHVTQPSVCAACSGEGTKKQGQKQKCAQCDGRGREAIQQRLGPGMVQQVITTCRRCNGTGSFIKSEDICAGCRGSGVKPKSEEVTVDVPPGAEGGMVLVMQGMGGKAPGAQAGDLNVHLEQVPHATFQRRGDDLIIEHNATLIEALTGVEIKLTLPDGRVTLVKSDAAQVLRHDAVIAVPGEGMPNPHQKGRGTLYVRVKVVMPTSLSKDQKDQLEKVLGSPRRDASGIPKGSVMHAKTLKETFPQLEQSKANAWVGGGGGGGQRGERRARGPSGGMGGGPGEAQCVQQ